MRSLSDDLLESGAHLWGFWKALGVRRCTAPHGEVASQFCVGVMFLSFFFLLLFFKGTPTGTSNFREPLFLKHPFRFL